MMNFSSTQDEMRGIIGRFRAPKNNLSVGQSMVAFDQNSK
jgi:hypothetical protein